MKEQLAQYAIEYGILLGAIIGGIAAMKTSREQILSRLISFFVGVPVAVAISPLLCSILNITTENVRMGIAVIAGYGGINLLNRLLNVLYKKIDKYGES